MSRSQFFHPQIANNYYPNINALIDPLNQTSWTIIQPLLWNLQEALKKNPNTKRDEVLPSFLCSCLLDLIPDNKEYCSEILQCLRSCLMCCSISTQSIYLVVYYYCDSVGIKFYFSNSSINKVSYLNLSSSSFHGFVDIYQFMILVVL